MKYRRTDSAAWLKAKSAGDESELLVARFLQSRGAEVLKICGLGRADLEARWTFEVKHDLIAPTSGRVAVEVEYVGQPSGIVTTPVRTWFYHIGDEILWLEVTALRDLLTAGDYEAREAGDGKRARVKLVPMADMRRIARTIIRGDQIP